MGFPLYHANKKLRSYIHIEYKISHILSNLYITHKYKRNIPLQIHHSSWVSLGFSRTPSSSSSSHSYSSHLLLPPPHHHHHCRRQCSRTNNKYHHFSWFIVNIMQEDKSCSLTRKREDVQKRRKVSRIIKSLITGVVVKLIIIGFFRLCFLRVMYHLLARLLAIMNTLIQLLIFVLYRAVNLKKPRTRDRFVCYISILKVLLILVF